MIALHMALVLRRLARASPPDRRLERALTERFMVDMDDGMREMTFGDLAVPREVKRAAAALFDRYNAYAGALAEPGDASQIKAALAAQLSYLVAGTAFDPGRLAAYVRSADRALAGQATAAILAGELAWPDIGDHPQSFESGDR
jgi:cytochrome b pre-mRNA-processing protein 3